MIRLVPDHSAQIRRSPWVNFTYDGIQIQGHAGESLAAALIRSGHLHLRDAPEDSAPRGAFCLTGLCQECVVQLAGRSVESCRVEVQEGLQITSLKRRADG